MVVNELVSEARESLVAQLEGALGVTLADAEYAATARANAGIAPGRAGGRYPSMTAAAIDHRRQSLEIELHCAPSAVDVVRLQERLAAIEALAPIATILELERERDELLPEYRPESPRPPQAKPTPPAPTDSSWSYARRQAHDAIDAQRRAVEDARAALAREQIRNTMRVPSTAITDFEFCELQIRRWHEAHSELSAQLAKERRAR